MSPKQSNIIKKAQSVAFGINNFARIVVYVLNVVLQKAKKVIF